MLRKAEPPSLVRFRDPAPFSKRLAVFSGLSGKLGVAAEAPDVMSTPPPVPFVEDPAATVTPPPSSEVFELFVLAARRRMLPPAPVATSCLTTE